MTFYLQAEAQKTYFTRQGFLALKILKDDSLITNRFQNIAVTLDYERAIVDLSFRLNNSLSNVSERDQFFSDDVVKINTRLSIPKIETQPHPDLTFHTKGELYYDELVYYLTGEGQLKHLKGSETMACSLIAQVGNNG